MNVSATAFSSNETKLYHYETFSEEYLTDVLEYRRVHCSDPANLNDPWDCKPCFDLDCLKEPDAKRLISNWFIGHPDPPRNPREQRHLYMMENDEFTIRRYVQSLTEKTQRVVSQNGRIYCLTPDPMSTLMWSHYTKNHRGICLEFGLGKTRCLDEPGRLNISLNCLRSHCIKPESRT
jgi:hypothetical protein